MSTDSQGDIGAILDATTPVEMEWQGHKIAGHVYTIGRERLTQEERQILDSLAEAQGANAPTASDDNDPVLLTWLKDNIVPWARKTIPIMLAGWDLDGSPMTRGGEPFPPTYENACRLPDQLIAGVAIAASEVWTKANPTVGAPLEDTSESRAPDSISSEALSQTETSGS